jgi:hypothetical protein
MSYDLEKINSAIAECLTSGNSYDDLKRLQSEKADLIDREYFASVESLRAEIAALQAQRQADVETQKALELDLTNSAMEVDRIAGILQQAREIHADINGRLLLMKFGFDNNRLTTNEKKAELSELIKNKVEQI